MANDFLSNLLKMQSNIPAPLDTEEARLAREKAEDERLRREDPEAFMPAVESDEGLAPGLTRQKIEKSRDQYKSFSAESDANVQKEIAASDAMQSPITEPSKQISPSVIPQQPSEQVDTTPLMPASSKTDQYSDLLKAYQSLKPAQEQYRDQLGNLAMLQGANQIAQGMARGFGAEIGAGETGIKALKEQAQAPLEALQQQVQIGKANLGLETEVQMIDPNSDISKFSRQQAAKIMATRGGKLDPKLEEQYTKQFSGLSAAQLEKAGFKDMLSLAKDKGVHFDRVQLPDGSVHVMALDNRTGEIVRDVGLAGYANLLDKDIYGNLRATSRSNIAQGPISLPQQNEAVQTMQQALPSQDKGLVKIPSQKIKEKEISKPSYKDIIEYAPAYKESIDTTRKDLNKEMQDLKDVAGSLTILSHKLGSGGKYDPKNPIDSGFLGSIQTQAAKMAGQKGVLTDQDLKKFGGKGGWKAAAQRAYENAINGSITEADQNFFTLFKEKMSDSLNEDIKNRSQFYVDGLKQQLEAKFPKIDEDTIKKLLSTEKIAPEVQNKKLNEPKIIKVKGPSGQVVPMTEENAKKYLNKPGYSEVK